MTSRNFTKELNYSYYPDYENGTDIETICHPSLIYILTEFVDRIEALETEVKILNRKLTDDTFEVIKNENCN
jgi:hypothetical protein